MSDPFSEAVSHRAVRVSDAENLPVEDFATWARKRSERQAKATERGEVKKPPGAAVPYTPAEEGANARKKGRAASSNPYDRDATPSLHFEWLRGYRTWAP